MNLCGLANREFILTEVLPVLSVQLVGVRLYGKFIVEVKVEHGTQCCASPCRHEEGLVILNMRVCRSVFQLFDVSSTRDAWVSERRCKASAEAASKRFQYTGNGQRLHGA